MDKITVTSALLQYLLIKARPCLTPEDRARLEFGLGLSLAVVARKLEGVRLYSRYFFS